MDRVCLCKDSELVDVTQFQDVRHRLLCTSCGGTQWGEER